MLSDTIRVGIITGGTSGLGEALAKQWCEMGNYVITVGRRDASFVHPNIIEHIVADLSVPAEVERTGKRLVTLTKLYAISKIVLVHNAGTLGTIKPLELLDATEMAATTQLNLLTPMQLTATLLQRQRQKTFDLEVVFISSGAATTPYHGWSMYGATKAGIEYVGKTLALEQEENPAFRVVSIRPGVIDTPMQEQIRQASERDFAEVHRFKSLYDNKQLSTPNEVAAKLWKFVTTQKFSSGAVIDLREISGNNHQKSTIE